MIWLRKPKDLKNTFTLILIGLGLLFGWGCSDFSPTEASASLKVKKYFDLKGFMQEEVKRLSGREAFTKSLYVNGETETKSEVKIDLDKELDIFSESDINRPAWSDKYKVDSLFNEQKELLALTGCRP